MVRLVWLAIVALFVTIPLATATMLVAAVRSTSPAIDWIIRLWAKSLVKAAGIELRTENLGTIQPNQRYILVGNHHSYLDIPCIFAAIPQPIRFFETWQEVPGTGNYDNGFKVEWEMFIRHLYEDAPFKYTLLEGAKGLQLVEAAHKSWKERRWIDIPALKV